MAEVGFPTVDGAPPVSDLAEVEPAAVTTSSQRKAEGESLSEEETAALKKAIVEESIFAYDGNCPCPYHAMSNGRRCGGRSAYSRGGGEAPLCYERDVTMEVV